MAVMLTLFTVGNKKTLGSICSSTTILIRRPNLVTATGFKCITEACLFVCCLRSSKLYHSKHEKKVPIRVIILSSHKNYRSRLQMEPRCFSKKKKRTKVRNCLLWKLRVFENMVLRRIFGPRRDEVTGEWRRLHNE